MKLNFKSIKFLIATMAIATLAITAGCTEQNTNNNSSATSSAQVDKASSSSNGEKASSSSSDKLAGVTIYFPDANGEKLIPVQRHINATREDKYQAVVQALIDGPKSDKEGIYIMPKDTQVLSVKVQNNIATVDFNKAFKANFTGGSTGEIMLIGSIVDSLTEFPEIKAVRFTMNGTEIDGLDGHLDLSKPQKRMGDLL